MNTKNIDFIIYWVDGNDPQWQQRRALRNGEEKKFSEARFRDWGLLRYWFRAVETYAPWVHRVFFVSDGQVPKWLNRDCEKLRIVDHKDFIPSHLLPTFNSHTIELNLHRIEGLSEQFVVFNDDTFLNAPIKPSYYFRKGLPCAAPLEMCFHHYRYTREARWCITLIDLCNVEIINHFFSRRKTVREAPKKWIGSYLGLKNWLISMFLTLVRIDKWQRFQIKHNEKAYIKSTFVKVWEKIPEVLEKSCTPLRGEVQVNQWLMYYWQMASNQFAPSTAHRKMKYAVPSKKDKQKIEKWLNDTCITSLCINDTSFITDEEYHTMRPFIKGLMQKKLPHRSIFEREEKDE